jgi:hypothetical protein
VTVTAANGETAAMSDAIGSDRRIRVRIRRDPVRSMTDAAIAIPIVAIEAIAVIATVATVGTIAEGGTVTGERDHLTVRLVHRTRNAHHRPRPLLPLQPPAAVLPIVGIPTATIPLTICPLSPLLIAGTTHGIRRADPSAWRVPTVPNARNSGL